MRRDTSSRNTDKHGCRFAAARMGADYMMCGAGRLVCFGPEGEGRQSDEQWGKTDVVDVHVLAIRPGDAGEALSTIDGALCLF